MYTIVLYLNSRLGIGVILFKVSSVPCVCPCHVRQCSTSVELVLLGSVLSCLGETHIQNEVFLP